jgi:hypothetical protein
LRWGYLTLFLAKTTLFCYCSGQVGSFIEPRSASNLREPLCRTLNLRTFRRSLTTLRQSATSWTVSLELPPRLCSQASRKQNTLPMSRAFVAAAQPRDAIEDLLTRDVIDLSWDVLRLRRLKAGLLRGAISSSIYQVMCRLGYEDEYAGELAANWAAGKRAAQKTVAGALQKAQRTMEDVMAETLQDKIDSFERFDRLMASSEARRNNALREIERHRAALGAAVRQAVDDEIQDAEFRYVDTGEVGGAPPS